MSSSTSDINGNSSSSSGDNVPSVPSSSSSNGSEIVKSSSFAATDGKQQQQIVNNDNNSNSNDNEVIQTQSSKAKASSDGNSNTAAAAHTTATTATNNSNNNSGSRHYSAAAFPPQQVASQKTHYSQWPLPPHTYAAGRQHDGSANNSSNSSSGNAGDKKNQESNRHAAKVEVKREASSTSSNNNDDEEELLVKSSHTVDAKKPQPIYSSSSTTATTTSTATVSASNKPTSTQPPPPQMSSTTATAPWGAHPHHHHAHPHHPSHPHHPHHAQYQAHYQQWYRHYAHHHQQQQQQQQHQRGPHGQPHAHYHHWHRQQQQQQHYHSAHHKSAATNTNNSNSNTTTTTTAATTSDSHAKQSHHHNTTIYPSRSNDSSTGGMKRTVRELSSTTTNATANAATTIHTDSRDESNTMRRMEEENSSETPTSCSMSLGDFSMASLGSSSPKGKRRKGTSKADDDTNSLELSDKEIMNNLSMNSSYSSDMAAMLYGTSPTHNNSNDVGGSNSGHVEFDLGKTPKKNNTSSKKTRGSEWSSGGGTISTTSGMDEAVFRLDSMTPRFKSSSDTDDGSSPALLDLIGGAETPTTGLLMTNIENAMMDDISLNRNLRGHAFTPLPHMLGADTAALGGSGGDASGLSITPQLSWSTNNGSPLEITPRCFGLLDSTKSTNKNPLGSPKSFWKENTTTTSGGGASDEKRRSDGGSNSGEKPSILSLLSPTMREMEISQDTSMDGSRSTTPLPLNYGKKDQKGGKKEDVVGGRAEFNQKTPVQKHHPGHGGGHNNMMRGGGQHHHHHQPPHMHHMQASPWAQLGGYMPSPVPGAFPNMSPGFGMYPQMEPNPNDRIRNLRGRGPPVHAIPPPHRLPPPTYHHFSPLTNVMKRPSRPMSYHHPHGNVPPQVDVSASSKSNCVPMKPPIPSKFQGDITKFKDVTVPDFNNLVNFPCHMNQKSAPSSDGTRNCVMCGHTCPCSMGGKNKNRSHPLADNNQNKGGPGMNNNFAIIPSQNKGLCTLCDVNVWIVVNSGLEIKWCKGCKNFRPWAAFGEKGLATKCVRCRERQREKYALEKEKKERAKNKNLNASSGRGVVASN